MKVIVTGATGMVGEGVLLECLQNDEVSKVLTINRKHDDRQHLKLSQLVVPDFFRLGEREHEIRGYDACFFCSGVSSIGMGEEKYKRITYDTTLSFAKAFLDANPNSVFHYVSGSHTDSTESARLMWARVKGKTENDLMRLPFKAVYNFRPGVMLPMKGQKNWKTLYEWMGKMMKFIAPKSVLSVGDVGRAMIKATSKGYSRHILEVADIRIVANS
ncbi:NAD-dependent epimerase/dehydratase family protein [Flavobacterium selenitireducens]|uniref:NAD-dependent epimerase/dehydratase family protein n=1 Tax=Flavobacterium selenitireducens TaxID=2722704 RepID=UPI00168AB68D|nr:NAD-dependent epimerase/dehydratase family protein [Flavobacterium selenitireducens]MBD3583289.1 NAD-dependent epimerase/dehydratase family protein [Flavobacterium selenitireducens]